MVFTSKRIINYFCIRFDMNQVKNVLKPMPRWYITAAINKDEKAFDYSFNPRFVCFL